jgi:hypothetical protein
MPRIFVKTIDCGCVIKTILCGIQPASDSKLNLLGSKMYILGSHDYFTICCDCKKKYNLDDDDPLYDMWLNDNITDEYGFAGWQELKKK